MHFEVVDYRYVNSINAYFGSHPEFSAASPPEPVTELLLFYSPSLHTSAHLCSLRFPLLSNRFLSAPKNLTVGSYPAASVFSKV